LSSTNPAPAAEAGPHGPRGAPPDAPGTVRGQLLRSSAVVGLGTALSRVTGFLRISAIAAIGFGRLTDVYNIANSTPNMVYELLLGGILTATLVPLYVEHLQNDDERASSAVNTLALAGLVLITVLGVVAAPWIIRLFALNLKGEDRSQQIALATALLRLFMPQVFFYGVTALATAMLNARRRFAAAAFAPVLNNVVVIAVFLALPRLSSAGRLDVADVHGDLGLLLLMGLGTTAGIVAMAVALVPPLLRSGTRLRLVWEWRHPAVVKLLRLSGWTAGYVAANQVAQWLVLVLALGSRGDASVYVAAFIIYQLPHGLFAVSIMTAIAPELAARATRHDLAGMRDEFAMGLRLMVLVIAPASVALVTLSVPLVNAALLHGNLSLASARLTAQTLAWFGVGLVFFSTYLYTLRGFYSLQDTRTPFWVNLGENALNIGFALVLHPIMGVTGLALAWSIAYGVSAVVAVALFRRRLGRLDGRRTLSAGLRTAAASVALGGAAWLVAESVGTTGPWRSMLATVLAGLAGVAVYVGALRALRSPELAELADAFGRRRRRPPAGPGRVEA